MRRLVASCALCLSLFGGAPLSEAETLDVGPSLTTVSWSSYTRGFWYEAPTDHTITALRVPLMNGGVQNIQVVSFDGNVSPPYWPGQTTAHTQLFYTNSGASGNQWVNVNIPITTGSVIGILGARGTSSLDHAYASVWSYETTIGGSTTTLRKLSYQSNLHSSQAGLLSAENDSYTRIEMQYVPFLDSDGDGDADASDCDDADPNNFNGNTEVCDGQDNDCDTTTEAAGGEVDIDGDG
jgi:hypothetical protein